jgi:hypothetical protein
MFRISISVFLGEPCLGLASLAHERRVDPVPMIKELLMAQAQQKRLI